jgi:hypothetical protein
MRANALLFYGLAGFFLLADVIYWFASKEPAGTTALAFAVGLAFLVGYYLDFNGRRLPVLPEDSVDAEIADGAGEVGFFPPHSFWPLYMAAGAAILMLGFVFGWWLLLIGVGCFGAASLGLVFEYYLSVSHGAKPPDTFHS